MKSFYGILIAALAVIAGLLLLGFFAIHGVSSGWFSVSFGIFLPAVAGALASLPFAWCIFQLLRKGESRGMLSRQAAQESEQRSMSIIETAFDAFISIDAKGIIQQWNRQAETTFGWTKKEVIGSALARVIIPPQYRQAHLQGMARYRETTEGPILNKRIQITAMHRDGHEFPVELTIWALKTGNTISFNAFIHDITEAKKAEEKLKEIGNMKSEFAAMVSHELRTPLAVIKDGIGIVLDGTTGPVNPEQTEYLGIAKRNVDRLGRLIHNVLDYQKLEANRVEFRMQPENISLLVEEVAKGFMPLAAKKGVSLSCQFPKDPIVVSCDRDKIIQVTTNLLNNALAFTEQGSITVTVEPSYRGVRVAIKDDGPGIAEADKIKLFQSFSQITSDKHRKTGGTGLGLAISRKIVEAHKGEIGVESQPGRGSTFYFVLSLP